MQPQSAPGTGGRARLHFLDGLRGWAALVVLLHHVFVDGLPPNALMADRALCGKVVFLNGMLAVCIFFVISGFSLSIRYFETGDRRGLGRIAAGRYLRLALPIFAICAITYVLLLVGLIAPAGQRPPPLDQFLTFVPRIDHLLNFSSWKVFFAYSDADTYDPPLWTMSYELYGSFLVFALALCLRPSRSRSLILGTCFLALAAAQSFYALFIGGLLIADLFPLATRFAAASKAGALLCAVGLALIL